MPKNLLALDPGCRSDGPVIVSGVPGLVGDLRPITQLIPNPPGLLLNRQKREATALELIRLALATCLLDHGWTVQMEPG